MSYQKETIKLRKIKILLDYLNEMYDEKAHALRVVYYNQHEDVEYKRLDIPTCVEDTIDIWLDS